MADVVSAVFADKVERGEMTAVEGLAALIVECGNQTPALRPDPLDPAFIYAAGRIVGRLLADAKLNPITIGVDLARAGIMAGTTLLHPAPAGGERAWLDEGDAYEQ